MEPLLRGLSLPRRTLHKRGLVSISAPDTHTLIFFPKSLVQNVIKIIEKIMKEGRSNLFIQSQTWNDHICARLYCILWLHSCSILVLFHNVSLTIALCLNPEEHPPPTSHHPICFFSASCPPECNLRHLQRLSPAVYCARMHGRSTRCILNQQVRIGLLPTYGCIHWPKPDIKGVCLFNTPKQCTNICSKRIRVIKLCSGRNTPENDQKIACF